jgi:uncharacterized protein YecE (DUF72 family)
VVHKLVDYLIGTGGWAYFNVPGLRPLVAYSKLFDFVEVNSTFYQIPNLKTVESWRRQVPPSFEFSVRCNRDITHNYQFQPREEAFITFEKMLTICKTLRAEILHAQTPSLFQPNVGNATLIHSFMSSVDPKDVRIALEIRGANQRPDSDFVKMMRVHKMIHSVDLSKDEQPAYRSDILYSRLFGRGWHNVYQPTDQELKKIDERASSKDHKKAIVSFHFIRMYKDAARLKMYRQTGRFPMVTKSTGLKSLEEILREDARFPAEKHELVRDQGWKLIDKTRDERIRASEALVKLSEREYTSVDDVIQTLDKAHSL